MKNTLLYSSIIILVIFNLVFMRISKAKSMAIRDITIDKQAINEEFTSLLKLDSLQTVSNFYSLNTDLLIADTNGDTIPLRQIIDKPTLVIRTNEVTCGSCIDDILERIKQSEFPTKNLCILTRQESLRRLILLKQTKQIRFPVYSIVSENLGIPLEEYPHLPYSFIIDDNFITENVSIYIKAQPGLFYAYLNGALNYFKIKNPNETTHTR